MELEKVRATENVLEFNVIGETHTFLNILRQILSDEIEEVQFAAYKSVQYEKPKFYIRVDPEAQTDPYTVLKQASKKIIDYCDELIEQVDKLK